jgi:hypothetical protein
MQVKKTIGTGSQSHLPTIAHVHMALTCSLGDHHA